MIKLKSMRLSAKECQLISYLYYVKIANRKQISRDIYKKQALSTVQRRIRMLKERNIISSFKPDGYQKSSFQYSLTTKGFNLFRKLTRLDSCSKKFKSDSHNHDLTLVDIRDHLKKLSFVKKYYTENQLQNYELLTDDDSLKAFKELRFDACMLCEKENGLKRYFAIQFEQSHKNDKRYRSLITDYYLQNEVKAILYVCSDQMIENKIKKIEKKFFGSRAKKIYFIQLDDLFGSKSEIIFKNQDNKSIELV